MSFRVSGGAAVRRRWVIAIVALAMMAGGVDTAAAQIAASTSTRQRVATRDSARTRRERLLIRFDSLRNAFEHDRLSEGERQVLADEMHLTMMALEASLDDVGYQMRTDAARLAQEDGMRGQTMLLRKRRDNTRGYLGLSFDGPNVDELRDGERIIRFLDYPRIALVEPSSPAERAGIAEGDTLLALNGSDVRGRAISLTKLLVPDRRVDVRVRRDGSARDFRVTIVEAPGYVMTRMAPMPPMPAMPPTRVRVFSSEEPMPPTPAVAATPAPVPGVAFAWVTLDGVAGARLESVSEGLGRALGTKYGVLVLRAAPGSPAFESGLRDGDVILRADGDTVRSVRELRVALQDADSETGVKLVVLRERKQREVTLRW